LSDPRAADCAAAIVAAFARYNASFRTITRRAPERFENRDWSGSYGIAWDDSSQGPELYEGFIGAAIENALTPNAAWYCWHASRRQAMLEAVWEKFGAFVHQQIVWAKDRGILTRSYYLWQHEPCFFGWLRAAGLLLDAPPVTTRPR